MKTTPITPAAFNADASPTGDPQPTQALALLQARRVFVQGNGLPARWQGRTRFVVLETHFDLAHRFLATWDAWRQDPKRCARLCFVSIDAHPPRAPHLAQAHQGSPLWPLAEQLVRAWPPLTPNLHSLFFEAGQVQLVLALGELGPLLPALHLQADAFFMDAGAAQEVPGHDLVRLAKALGRKAAPGATLATVGDASPAMAGALRSAGFETGDHAQELGYPHGLLDALLARYAPRFVVRTGQPPHDHAAPRSAVVVGAGLAGAAAARALAQQGLHVTVLEAQDEPATRASGNAAGLFHGTVNGDDGAYARLFRAAALAAAREYATAMQPGADACAPVAGHMRGLLRLDLRPGGLTDMQALLSRQRWPQDYVQALSAQQASEMAGVPLSAPAWYYPAGGWISPPQWVRFALRTPGVQLQLRSRVQAIHRMATGWQLELAPHTGERVGSPYLQAEVVVLAHTQAADTLLQSLGHTALPLSHTSGQITHVQHPAGASLHVPVAGDGYALALPFFDGAVARPGLLCGATRNDGQPIADGLPPVTAQDHQTNLARLHRLLGLDATAETMDFSGVHGRAAWRLNSSDRMPIAGAVPCVKMSRGQRMDQARLLPREPGLFVLTALGARGLTLAPLLAQLVAAQACQAPWPLEQDLVDAVDPARWRVRAARRTDSKDPL